VRRAAVVHLHPRLDRAADQRAPPPRLVRAFAARAPRAAAVRPSSTSASAARSSVSATTSSCVSTRCQNVGRLPTSGATDDSTLGYALGARGILMLPCRCSRWWTCRRRTRGMIRQKRRWYKGVLDDVAYLRGVWRARPSAVQTGPLTRHVGQQGGRVAHRPLVYPLGSASSLHWPTRFSYQPRVVRAGVDVPDDLACAHRVGRRHRTQDLSESLTAALPRPVNVADDPAGEVLGIFAARPTGFWPRRRLAWSCGHSCVWATSTDEDDRTSHPRNSLDVGRPPRRPMRLEQSDLMVRRLFDRTY